MGEWCTVTVSDGQGKRYSLNVYADSSYDAAHLYLTHVRGNPGCGFPIPTTSTLFEVVADAGLIACQERASRLGSRADGKSGKARADSSSASARRSATEV